MAADANAEAVLASLQTPEMERAMMWVLPPQAIVLDRKLLDLWRQRVEQIPEPRGRYGVHSRGGHSRRRPLAG